MTALHSVPAQALTFRRSRKLFAGFDLLGWRSERAELQTLALAIRLGTLAAAREGESRHLGLP